MLIDARAGFDMRVTPSYPLDEMLSKLDEWAKEAGEGVEWADGPTYEVFSFSFCFLGTIL